MSRRRPDHRPTRRTRRTAALLAASLTAGVSAVGATAAAPGAGADPLDRLGLPVQTQIVGGAWDVIRPLADQVDPTDDVTFYTVPKGVDLQSVAPGTPLRERQLTYGIDAFDEPVTVTQILYATTDVHGNIEENVTSVFTPPGGSDGNVFSYQSFYDTSNPADNPSRLIAGNSTIGSQFVSIDARNITPALQAGHAVILADTEGKDANFAAGPAYGTATLDSVRAAERSVLAPVEPGSPTGFFGYSGGAIASGWAAALMPTYAPELVGQTVGVAEGGVLVNPVNNLAYAGEGSTWAGVVGFALASLARTYGVDFTEYTTDYGTAVLRDMANLSIIEAAGRYPDLRWADLAKPEYPTPESVPEFATIIDEINLGNRGAPQVPMFIGQGDGGTTEGTPVHPELGSGDGIMLDGDVRALARQYCAAGTPVEYRQYTDMGHSEAQTPWQEEAMPWLEARFHGSEVTQNCADIAPGNEL